MIVGKSFSTAQLTCQSYGLLGDEALSQLLRNGMKKLEMIISVQIN